MEYRGDIQGIRALAILLVFIFHLNSDWLSGGFVGVDVFFVISGFLITSIILEQKQKKTFRFLSFYKRRLKRIAPAYYVMIACVAILAFLQYLYTDLFQLKEWLLSSIVYLSNIIFAGGDSYFGAKSTENPLLHTWSLAIEMQFYLVLPLLLLFVKDKFLIYLISFLIIAITLYSSYQLLVVGATSLVYFSLIARMPEFLCGSLAALLFRGGKRISKELSRFIAPSGMFLILMSAFFITESSPFPGILALIPCVGAVMLIVSDKNSVNNFLSGKIFVYLGELSYSFYLWHWPIMALLRYHNDRYQFTFVESILVITFTLLLGSLSYHFVETSFRKQSNRVYIRYFVPSFLLICLFCYFIPKVGSFKKLPEKFIQQTFGLASHGKLQLEYFGDSCSKTNVLFIGDSNALALKCFFDYMGKKDGFSFRTVTCDTYPPIDGLVRSEISRDVINPNQMKYFDLSREIANFVRPEIRKSEIIILNCIQYDRIPSEKDAVRSLIQGLKDNQKLIVINTFPRLSENPIKRNKGIVKRNNNTFTLEYKKIPESIMHLIETKGNVYCYDVSKSRLFESAPYLNDTTMYYDEGHLNRYGALALAKDLERDFNMFWKQVISN